MVISLIALFVALGGSATAGVLITGSQIQNSTVTSIDIKNNSIRTRDVRNGTLLAADFKTGQLPTGPAGPTGAAGPAGAAGTARAYAQVNNAGSGSYVAGRTQGFTALSRPSTGVYCLTVDPTLAFDPETVAAVANVEFGNTPITNVGYAWVRGSATSSCPAGNFAVHTFVLTGGALVVSNAVAFNIIAP